MKNFISEAELEEMALDFFRELKYGVINGVDIAPDGPRPERKEWNDVVLVQRLREAIERIPENKNIPTEGVEQAIKQVLRTSSQKLLVNNHKFHKLLVSGVDVEYKHKSSTKHDKVWLIDRENKKNEFLAINQFTIIENGVNRRPDIILFINGLPVVLIELKNPADEKTTIDSAFDQLQTYKLQLQSLYTYNEILIISDGIKARAGTLTANKERFTAWKTIDDKKALKSQSEMEVLIKGMLNKETLLDLIRHFIVYHEEAEHTFKILAAYHQYNAVNKALESTIKATKTDHRAGIVWHTQGSGKSLTMAFYAGKAIQVLDNPTLVILTDRNDLDDQLADTFEKSKELLNQIPRQAENRDELKKLLQVASGGVVFTTIQKFSPEGKKLEFEQLSDRSNIIVMADEAHRSQYGFKAKVVTKEDEAVLKYGFAKYLRDALPNASFIGFTGTPIETRDRSTPAVFGKNIDVYDIEQAIEDQVTVRIYYESRLAKIELKPEERPNIDDDFDEVTEGEEEKTKEQYKSKWARLEKVVGSKERIKQVAKDMLQHYDERSKTNVGKGMFVCMSRRIAVELYAEIIKLRPEWHDDDEKKGAIKVIMTGSAADGPEWQQHIRNKKSRRAIGERFKDPNDSLQFVIVRDMWLTGFDVPCLHTMYLDKPMKGHGLMQAIARVNRVFKDKQGGLIVDYIGIAPELKKALANYTQSGGKGKPTVDQEKAVEALLTKYETVQHMFHGFNYKRFFAGSTKDKMGLIPDAIEHILKQKDGKERYVREVSLMVNAFSISVPHKKALTIKDEVGLFQAIKAAIVKSTEVKGASTDNLDSAIRQIITKAIVSDRVIDVFAAAGLKKPNIAILSNEFLDEVKEMPQKNLAFETLKKLLNDEIRIAFRKNKVQERSFLELLEKSIRNYTNKAIEAAEVIQSLVDLAKDVRQAQGRGEDLGLTEDEVAFYDALSANSSAVKVLGNEELKKMALELTETIRKNVTIDWTLKENAQANLRVLVKRLLRKYGYPPDMQPKAVELVLEQATVIAKDWANIGADKRYR